MIALYRENILMFVNFAKNILNYINTNCTFSKKQFQTQRHITACTFIVSKIRFAGLSKSCTKMCFQKYGKLDKFAT